MSEIKAKIILTLDENDGVYSEIQCKGRDLCEMLATAFMRPNSKLLELIEVALEMVKAHQDNMDSKDGNEIIDAVNDILANHKPSKQ